MTISLPFFLSFFFLSNSINLFLFLIQSNMFTLRLYIESPLPLIARGRKKEEEKKNNLIIFRLLLTNTLKVIVKVY